MNEEQSESGSPIYRHREPVETDSITFDPLHADRIVQHIEQHLGPIEGTWNEIHSEIVPVNLHLVAPSESRPYYTLISSGMSQLAMTVPPGLEELRFAELVICLPQEWPLTPDDFQKEDNYWPIRWLKTLARLPHQYRTWLGVGHTIPHNDPPEPFAENTSFCGMMIAPCIGFGDHFPELSIAPNKVVHFYNLLPLYLEEMNYKLKHGFEALLKKWDTIEVTEVVDLHRANGCKE